MIKKVVLTKQLAEKLLDICGLPCDWPYRRIIIEANYDGLVEIKIDYLGFVEVPEDEKK